MAHRDPDAAAPRAEEAGRRVIKSKRIPLGPWGLNVALSARQAHRIRHSLPYQKVVRPALTALERFADRSHQWTGELPPGAHDTPAARVIWDKVMAVPQWYHTIELPYGLVTPGHFDHRPVLEHYHLPARLDGKRVLDVATFDGFWAFEMERRGAREVVAIDVESWTDLDLPPRLKQIMIDNGVWEPLGVGFNIAKRSLGSRVQRRLQSVYDLSPRRVGGRFDFIFCGDLLLHLINPPRALQRIYSVSGGEAIFVDVCEPELDSIDGSPVTRYLGGWNTCTWWTPSLRCLVQMVQDAGFRDVEVLETFVLAQREGYPLTRAVIHAHS
jgi:tRNA (mo5U34)-methyltransferase